MTLSVAEFLALIWQLSSASSEVSQVQPQNQHPSSGRTV